MKRTFQEISENVAVSIIEHSEEKYEIAVMYRPYPNLEPNGWEIDYSVFNDVITVTSSMQVYGTIEYEIKPAYLN